MYSDAWKAQITEVECRQVVEKLVELNFSDLGNLNSNLLLKVLGYIGFISRFIVSLSS